MARKNSIEGKVKNIYLRRKRHIMLDGSRTGETLTNQNIEQQSITKGVVDQSDSRMEMSGPESAYLLKMMKAAEAREVEDELHFPVRRKGSTMILSMRNLDGNAKRKYLNLSGNPISFIEGNNLYGSPNPVPQLVFCWKKCLERLAKKSKMPVPERLWSEVDHARIHIHSMEWACYTIELKDPLWLIRQWHDMFHLTRTNKNGKNNYLAKMLKVSWIDAQYEDSFRLKILDNQGKTLCMIGFYDKAAEMMRRTEEDGPGAVGVEIPETIRNRLRVDINFNNLWFKNKRLARLDLLEDWIDRKFGGDWSSMVYQELMNVIDRTHLIRMFQLDGAAILKAHKEGQEYVEGMPEHAPTSLLVPLMYARVTGSITDEEMVKYMSQDSEHQKWVRREVRKIKPNQSALRFDLDTSRVIEHQTDEHSEETE